MSVEPYILLHACLATLLGAGALLAAALIGRMRDKVLTILVAIAGACGAGYVAAYAATPIGHAGIDQIARREVVATSLFIVFCGLAPWIWHRSGRFTARPLLVLTTFSAGLLFASNLVSPYSLRYANIGLGDEGHPLFTSSGWIFTLASLIAIISVIAAASAVRTGFDGGRVQRVGTVVVAAFFAGAFCFDLALGSRSSAGALLEALALTGFVASLLFERFSGQVRFTHVSQAEQEAALDRAFEVPTAVTLLVDQDGCVLTIDRDLTGAFAGATGECFAELPPFAYDKRVSRRLRQAIADMTSMSKNRIRTPARLEPSRESWLDVTLQRVVDTEAGRVFALVEARDITQLKQLQETFGEVLQSRSGTDESTSLIISRFAHELRTPLTPILGFSDLLMNDNRVPPDLRAHARVIRNSANALSARISRVFDLTGAQAEEYEPQRDVCETRRILDMLRLEAEDRLYRSGKDVRVQVLLTETAPPSFFADERMVMDVLRKLIDNAAKFTSSGSITLSAARLGESDVEITVADTGPGVAEDQRQAIFEPFYQDAGRASNEISGLGLGLTIARNLAKQIGAELAVAANSRATCGAAFSLRLAEAAPAYAPDSLAEETGLVAFENRVVLLVEDDDSTRDFLSRFLNSRGFSVLATSNGRDALEELREGQRPIDLLILDMRLPDVSGFDIVRATREWEGSASRARVPILALTAMPQDEGDRHRCLQRGCDGFLSKPVRASELLRKIDQLAPRLARTGTCHSPRGLRRVK